MAGQAVRLQATPKRAVDLYVDGKLIAWFYEAPAPARDAPLVYEAGRSGVWLGRSAHRCVAHIAAVLRQIR